MTDLCRFAILRGQGLGCDGSVEPRANNAKHRVLQLQSLRRVWSLAPNKPLYFHSPDPLTLFLRSY
jgi:hypothetical protein